jgi:hypothetical protein
MSEIYHFKVHKADARISDGRMTVRLTYPRNPEPIDKRLPENLPFGVKVFDRLFREDYAPIADEKNPIKPASGGSLIVLSDGKIVCHRRDKFAPSHKLYHSAYAGYTQSRDFVYSAKGLRETALRESAEECLLVTNEKTPWLVVPNDSRAYTLEAAKRLGLELRPRYVDVEVAEPSDVLQVFDEDGNPIFSTRAFLEFIYESQTSLNALQIRHIPLSSKEVIPVDAEGMVKDGKFSHFNRESYVISPAQIAGKPFGTSLDTPRVYKTRIESGVPVVFAPEYKEPHLGPDAVEVTHPHIWAPEDLLVRSLDGLGVDGYKGRWMEIELWKERSKLQDKNLLPEEVLRKKS